MKLLDLQLNNFRKLSNLPQPTIAFNQDINVLVGANNAGKTSILKAIQKLFGTEGIDATKDLNYLVKDGVLTVEGTIKLTFNQWKSFLLISLSQHPQISLDADLLATKLVNNSIRLRRNLNIVSKRFSSQQNDGILDIENLSVITNVDNEQTIVINAVQQIISSDIYNVYRTPLYLDSKGKILEQEAFVPLNHIENNPQDKVRGLLYALKKKEPKSFDEFKKRLLEIFTEIENFDVINNEDLGQFEFVIHEKLRKNGDTEDVVYDINNVGQGMQTLVIMLSTILLLKPSIVLMDEPEVHMHPSLIKEFVGYIKKLSVDTQFIMTTHSEILINEVGLDKVFYLKNDIEQKGIIVTKVDDKNKLLEAVSSLGYNVDSSVYTIKPAVFVFTEGPSDKDYIFAFAKKAGLESQINSFSTAFIEMGGKGNRYKFATLIEKLNQDFVDSPVLMILDRDETSNTTIEEITKKFFSKNPNRLHYLSKRQIENYLLDEKAIKQLVSLKIKKAEVAEVLEKWQNENIFAKFEEFAEQQKDKILNNYLSELFINDSLVNTKNLGEVISQLKDKPLKESAKEFAAEVSKLVTLKTFDLGSKTSTALEEFNNDWSKPNNKIEMCDGRKLLKSVRTWIQDEYKISFTDNELIEAMQSVPEEIGALLQKLTKPEDLKVG